MSATAALVVGLGALTGCGGGDLGGSSNSSESAAPPNAAAGKSTDQSTDQSTAGKPLRGKVVVIDPGHNGGNGAAPQIVNRQVDVGNGTKECDTTGTDTAGGYSEHAFTWDVSNKLKKILQAKGAKVILTRASDTTVGPCITERAGIGNRAKADAAVSVHADGAPTSSHGFHIITPLPVRGHNEKIVPASNKLGLAIRDAFHEGTGIPYSTYRGTKAMDPRDDLGGLNLSTVPKVFIECGNMKNPGDAAKLSSASFRQRIAVSLADGLSRYLR